MKQPHNKPVSAPTVYPTTSAPPMPGRVQVQPQIAQQNVGHANPYAQNAPMSAPTQPSRPQMQPQGQPQGQAYPTPQRGLPPAPMANQHPSQLQGQYSGQSHPPMQVSSPMRTPLPQGDREGGEKALPRIAIHSFCDRSETAQNIQAMSQDWRMVRTNLKIYMGGLPAAIDFYKSEKTPSLIIFESGLRGPELFSMLGQLAENCSPDTKVIMVGAVNDIKLYRELIDQGISDYIVPPFHPLTIIRAISDLYSDPEKPFTGKVIGFFGAKGGVGSSTLAHNIAWGLSTRLGQETSLVDLDSSWGTTGLDFNYDSVQGLEEALADHERLDETLLDRIMVRHTDKLSILPAGGTLSSIPTMDAEAYETLINGVRSLSPVTILDMPHFWTDWSSRVLVSCDDVVITVNPDLANLRNCKNLVEFLQAARPNDAAPLIVLNKTGVSKASEIPVKDFASAIGIDPALVLAYEPTIYTEASNDGKMLSDISAAANSFDGMMYLAHRLQTGQFPIMQSKKMGRFSRKNKSTPSKQVKTDANSKGGLLSKFTKRT